MKSEAPIEQSAIMLPAGINIKDTKYPEYGEGKPKRLYDLDFELLYSERFGWVIPTLLISKSRKYAHRVYAISVEGVACRVGNGPHIKATARVYVTEENLPALQKYIDLQAKGYEDANDTRDRISTRRMQTSMRRMDMFGF